VATEILETTCCVVGGGPAGMMLGYLLARQGVAVKVLEKHADFNRDFRGDTVHPSTLEVLHELGLLEKFLTLPHQRVTSAGAIIGGATFELADFSHVPARCKFVALMPQWDFLNFLSDRARAVPSFELLMQHEVKDLLRDGDRVSGVLAQTGSLAVRIQADLVVGCDGRHSVTRSAAGLELIDHGVPIDVLWFRISRKPADPAQVLGNVNYGKALILIDRADYFQAGLIIEKGSYERIKARGLGALRADIRQIAPFLGERVDELQDWEQIKILTVQINRLKRWFRPGVLCIGDAAHAMSPAGGVGINLAIQDAVAASNLLTEPLLTGSGLEARLAAVQRRREFPTRATQAIQLLAHRRLAQVFADSGPIQVPWQMKAFAHIPGIHRALGYVIGIGVRPEHIQEKRSGGRRPSMIRGGIRAGMRTGLLAGIGIAATAAGICWAVCARASRKRGRFRAANTVVQPV
jgi:2-polyprenyl-6-methoxyphenol hydroxylase-like FAD-dependent oxidoreductase